MKNTIGAIIGGIGCLVYVILYVIGLKKLIDKERKEDTEKDDREL